MALKIPEKLWKTRYRDKREWRRNYYDGRAVFGSCRAHGCCRWCETGRAHAAKRQSPHIDKEELSDFGVRRIK